MKIKLAIIVICLLSFVQTQAQSLRYAVALPYVGLGAYSKQQSDPLSFTSNQAALARVKNAGIGVFGERRFLLQETSAYTLGAAIPTRLGNFGVQVNYAGFKNFNEQKLGLAYARSLGRKVDIGVQFNYYGYRIPAYGNASSINFEAGAIFHFTDKVQGGIHVYNPVGGKIGKQKQEKLAAAYKAGLGYDASENFFISTEVSKEEDKPVNVTAGLQYRFAKKLYARGGFMSESTTAFAGVGIGWSNLRLDIAGSYHPQLGFSPGILLIVNFKGKSE
jgi:hypothetical protein